MTSNRNTTDAVRGSLRATQKKEVKKIRDGRNISNNRKSSNNNNSQSQKKNATAGFRKSSSRAGTSIGSSKGKEQGGNKISLESHNEIDSLGTAWRKALRQVLLLTFDSVNALRFTRSLQLFLPFLASHEAYALSELIEAMDKGNKQDIKLALNEAFKNRNVSRILVQNLGSRYDFLWHWSTMISWNRAFDAWGQLPLVGITQFPATENFPSTRNHALASIFRNLLGPGNWITRVVTRGREGLITDNEEAVAQNLAAESNGFELANRNQFGTYFGRQKLNEFRLSHRLPTDESIVRTFVAQPVPTMINNGVVHVLRQLSKHWHNMLNQPCGNFAHQRMEQLDPFETLRFHIPEVLLVLSSLRGRTEWDSRVMGPMIKRLQSLMPSPTPDKARKLVRELQATIIVPVCAGIPSVINPFRSWAAAIELACNMIEEEASGVYKLVSSVEKGIRLGHNLFSQVKWKVPSDRSLEKMILDHIDGKYLPQTTTLRIRSALQQTTPRDKRTLIELVKNNLAETMPAKLLLGRVKTLLQRELRRERLNQSLREMSTGATGSSLVDGEWYWLEETHGDRAIYIYDKSESTRDLKKFIHANSGKEKFLFRLGPKVKIRPYLAVGETISRAQKAFMTIELEYGKRFAYSAFMEFSYLRKQLRHLAIVSQLSCEELDNARLTILKETQRSSKFKVKVRDLVPESTYYTLDPDSKTYESFVYTEKLSPNDPRRIELEAKTIVHIPPQNIIVVGGGPTGLITAIHCAENVLISGGTVRLFEARDAFAKGGSSFERAQIVRLDARWIAMMRYHLGSGFEDVFIPASGETDSQLGNTLPTQGFVEITIKDLESLLHTEVSRLWSKGLLSVCSESKAKFDSKSQHLVKLGKHLKVKDEILRKKDQNGVTSIRHHTWKIVHLIYSQPLGLDDLQIQQDYGVYMRQENAVLPFKLLSVCLESKTYTFKSLTDGVENLEVNSRNLPSIYAKDTRNHGDVYAVVVECTKPRADGSVMREELLMQEMRNDHFILDTGNCHVIEAIGKPRDSETHLRMTTPEPYGVLCMQGLKVSMGMHNFGEKRWGSGLLDDIRSQNDQNTRIIGDFTKMVRLIPIMEKMHTIFSTDEDWRTHFGELLGSSELDFPNQVTTIVAKLERACEWQAKKSRSFRRQSLQCRFFETGDQFYLGMEFPREYEDWKNKIVDHICSLAQDEPSTEKLDGLNGQLKHHLDRLWYEACLETIRTGDVYNPGARKRVPRLYLINSYRDVDLGDLPVGESFRLSENKEDRFEVLVKTSSEVLVRNVKGTISRLNPSTLVRREGNLTRTPDGNAESKVSIATFPVSHYVNHRTMHRNTTHKDYTFAFIGDEQATPHFMRYSGLTGACVNAMLLNSFIRQAINDVSFTERFAAYSSQTHWSSSEVVTRGTGACFGQDGFLRPGFSYEDLINYLYARAVEHREGGQDLQKVLTRDWLLKIAASIVPRGLEVNSDFLRTLRLHLRMTIFKKVFRPGNSAENIEGGLLEHSCQNERKFRSEDGTDLMDWERVMLGAGIEVVEKEHWHGTLVPLAGSIETMCNQVIQHSTKAYVYNERISSELFIQPKPVDSILDDFAVESQNFANSLVLAVALSSASLTFRLIGSSAFSTLSAVVSVLSIFISFDTMTNVARYKIRNEEARISFYENKLSNLKKALLGMMGHKAHSSIPEHLDPFIIEIDSLVNIFQASATYYGCRQSMKLKREWQRLKKDISNRKKIRNFQKFLLCELIVDSYHINSYLQEDLVNIYKCLEDAIYYLKPKVDPKLDKKKARSLLEQLNEFTAVLDVSLQRGSIKWGFIKRRNFVHWDIVVVFRFLYSKSCCFVGSVAGRWTPIESSSKQLLNKVKRLASKCDTTILRRETRDLEELYWATHESDMASMIFLSAFLVFAASIVFSVARLFGIQLLEQAVFWASVPSTFGAVLAIFHLLRKLCILFDLWRVLREKAASARKAEDRDNIQMVSRLTLIQLLLTFLRLNAATTASIALPFSIAENGFGNLIGTPMMLPFWIALIALVQAVLATILFFVVEYSVRYHLSPKFPVIIVESFRHEINTLYWEFRRPWNDTETKQFQERETWEYVAREFLHIYRFDTVFAADRFGAILQYIQCGMETEKRSYYDSKPGDEGFKSNPEWV